MVEFDVIPVRDPGAVLETLSDQSHDSIQTSFGDASSEPVALELLTRVCEHKLWKSF